MLNRDHKILIIGAQNIDIFAHAKSDMKLHDSNISNIHMAFGGVACNIATNLALLENDISFITVFGSDAFSSLSRNNLKDLNINIQESLQLKNENSSIYLGVMDKENDLFLGLNDMGIIEHLNIDFFKQKANFIEDFEIIVIDNNLSFETLEYLLKTYQHKQIIMDAVSTKKVVKINDLLKHISLLKVNLMELEILSDKVTTDLKIDDLLSRGLKEIIVTNSSKEIIFKSKHKHIKTMPIEAKTIVNASGAGDAFISGFVHGIINNNTTDDCMGIAKKMAFQTLQSINSTNNNISLSSFE
jgi:pseudouridine kinase